MTTKSFKHAPCNEPLKVSSLNPKADDIVACPKCGLTVPYEVFEGEVQEYFSDKLREATAGPLRDAARRIKGFTFQENVRTQKVYRFITDDES